MANLFTVTSPTNTILLQPNRQAEASFTATNISGRPVRGRALLVPENPASAPWLQIRGAIERDFPIAGTEQYAVQIAAPQDAPAGSYVFRLDMVGVENPDEFYSQGPSVTFQVPEPAPVRKPFPWWIIAVAAGVLVLAVVAFLLWPRNVAVPDLRGSTVAAAIAQLNGANLQLARLDEVADDTVPDGQVVSSDPPAGASVRRGAGIVLLVSTGPANAEVPVVANLLEAEAKLKIVQAGLAVGATTQEFSALASGRVVRADPAEGQRVARGSSVSLVLSKGPAPLTVISVAADADTYWDPNGTLYIVGNVPDFGHGPKLILWNAPPLGSGVKGPLLFRANGPGLLVVHFPLTAIPAGAGIEKVTLGMNLEARDDNTLQVIVQRVVSPWSEDDRTKPTLESTGQVARPVNPASVPAWVEWNVTNLVRAMAAEPGQNFGLALVFTGDSGSRTFTSREGSAPQLRPRLEISYR